MNIVLISFAKLKIIPLAILTLLASMFFLVPTTQAATPETPQTDFIIEGLPNSLIVPKTTLALWNSSISITESSLALSQEISPEDLVSQTLGLTSPKPIKTRKTYSFNPAEIYNYLSENTLGFEQTKNAKLVIENNHATTFEPGQNGLHIDLATSTKNVIGALESQQSKTMLATRAKEPAKPLAGTNTLGINELIGRGESNFKGSPKNRRHNINVGMEKLKGTIIAPGEEFSFNENICPVEKSTGYLPELVIKSNDTVPEYGGGLCQVSSTVYRAAMDAGLTIVQRKNHSYAVQYYAVPWGHGADATTYCGGTDFRFKNDTPANILIWPYIKEKDLLFFDFYGTSDGREVTLEKAVQFDRKSDGSLKAYWKRTIIKDGEETKETFNSVYKSPALFHKKEELPNPAPATDPAANPQTPTPPVENTPPPPTPPIIN